MNVSIWVEPEDLWDFCVDIEFYADNLLLAWDDDNSIDIRLSGTNESNLVIKVLSNGEEIDSYDFDYSTAEYTLSEVYETYLYSEGFSEQLTLDEDEECYDCENRGFSLVEHQDEMDSREYELSDAVENFIETALNFEESEVLDDVIIEDCKEHFLKYLASKHGITGIYRPMILEDEDGEDFFTEYPYECLVFDEEDG